MLCCQMKLEILISLAYTFGWYKLGYFVRFLRNLFLITTTMDTLPPNVFMTVRLLYYDAGEKDETYYYCFK